MKANDMQRMTAEEAFSRDVAYNPMADAEAQAAAADAQKAMSFHVRLFTFVVVVAFALCALLLAGCANEGNAGAANDQNATAGEDAGNAAAEDADTHELVYIPFSYLGIEDDLFDENALWGVTLGDVPQILVMHIADGVIGENGEKIPLADLQPGDIVKATFTQIAQSYPGQISVDTCEFVRHGGTEAITPYDSEITAYEDAAITDGGNTN